MFKQFFCISKVFIFCLLCINLVLFWLDKNIYFFYVKLPASEKIRHISGHLKLFISLLSQIMFPRPNTDETVTLKDLITLNYLNMFEQPLKINYFPFLGDI